MCGGFRRRKSLSRGHGVLIRFDEEAKRLGEIGQGVGFLLTDFVQDLIEDGREPLRPVDRSKAKC